MACHGCNSAADQYGECDVCVLVSNDHKVKKVRYCSPCNAWLCNVCRPNYKHRAIAALRRTRDATVKALRNLIS